MIGMSTILGSVRINPVGLSRVAAPAAMGIVRLGERDAVRIPTDTREREGNRASGDARDVGERHVVVPDSVDGYRGQSRRKAQSFRPDACPRWSAIAG